MDMFQHKHCHLYLLITFMFHLTNETRPITEITTSLYKNGLQDNLNVPYAWIEHDRYMDALNNV